MLLSCSQAAEANKLFSATRLFSLSASGPLLTEFLTLEEITHGKKQKPSTTEEKEQTISLPRTEAQSMLIYS